MSFPSNTDISSAIEARNTRILFRLSILIAGKNPTTKHTVESLSPYLKLILRILFKNNLVTRSQSTIEHGIIHIHQFPHLRHLLLITGDEQECINLLFIHWTNKANPVEALKNPISAHRVSHWPILAHWNPIQLVFPIHHVWRLNIRLTIHPGDTNNAVMEEQDIPNLYILVKLIRNKNNLPKPDRILHLTQIRVKKNIHPGRCGEFCFIRRVNPDDDISYWPHSKSVMSYSTSVFSNTSFHSPSSPEELLP